MQSPFTKAGMELILDHWQQGTHIDTIMRALKTDTKTYLSRRVGLHDGLIYNAIIAARKQHDARAIKRFVRGDAKRPPLVTA